MSFWRRQDARQAARRAMYDALNGLAAGHRATVAVPLEWHSERGGALVGGEPLDRILAGENVYLDSAAQGGPTFCITPAMVRNAVRS